MTYKGKDGWFLVPVDLDAAVVEFEPTKEGCDKALEAFAKGALVTKPKTTTATSTKKAAAAKAAPKEEEAEEKDDDDDDEDDEKAEADDGDEG